MAKTPRRPNSTTKPATPRKTDAEVRSAGFSPFLRPEHTGDGNMLTLTGWNRESPDKRQWFVEVQDDQGQTFDMGIRKDSPDHRQLFKAFGPDPIKWVGGTVTVTIKAGRDAGTSFVNIAAVTADEPPF
jgi:hypothetical protein